MSKSDQLAFDVLDEIDDFVDSKESDEAYTTDTPRYPIISTVSSFFGGIGLDPTSNPEKSVPARHHFTRDDDCLSQSWAGLGPVFMNPPYSQALPFLEKASQEYQAGHVPEVIFLILCTTATNRRVGPLLRAHCSACCLLHGRPPFRFGVGHKKGTSGTLTVPSVIFYAGPRAAAFCEQFMRLGTTAYTHPLDHLLQEIAKNDDPKRRHRYGAACVCCPRGGRDARQVG